MITQRRLAMLFKKETNNAPLLAAIDGGSLENVLNGGNLISDQGKAQYGQRNNKFRYVDNVFRFH